MQTLVCLFCLEEAVRSYFIMNWFFEASFCFAGMEQLPLISPEWVNLVQNTRESYPTCMLAFQLLTSFRLASTRMWCQQTACHWLAWEWRPWMSHETDSFTRINSAKFWHSAVSEIVTRNHILPKVWQKSQTGQQIHDLHDLATRNHIGAIMENNRYWVKSMLAEKRYIQ